MIAKYLSLVNTRTPQFGCFFSLCYTTSISPASMFERKTNLAIIGGGQLTAVYFGSSTLSPDEASWAEEHSEGQLAVDVFETETDLVVVATMAGTRPEDIELNLQNDFLTIRGTRQPPISVSARAFYEECYWGRFSRTIVLPVDVTSELARSRSEERRVGKECRSR